MKHTTKRFKNKLIASLTVLVVLVIFITVFASNAHAFPINIDPGAYTGSYDLAGSGLVSGQQTFDLPQGTHFVRVAIFGGFFIDVDATGNVTSQDLAAAVGAGNTLTFNSTQITVDPGVYSTANPILGHWDIALATGLQQGVQTLTLVPNLKYQVRVALHGGFFINLDAFGNVTSQNIAAASSAGNTLTFNSTTILVEPEDSNTVWDVFLVNTTTTGPAFVEVVPNLKYQVRAFNPLAGAFFFVAEPCAVAPPS